MAESSFPRRKCSCNRHGCRWSQSFYSKSDESENAPRDSGKSSTEIVTSECVKENERDFRCDAPYHPVGKNKCTGMEHGDHCELECPDGFVKEQHGHGFRIYSSRTQIFPNTRIFLKVIFVRSFGLFGTLT